MTSPAPDLVDVSIELLSALLDSAQVEVIGVANWWHRAQTALETAAAGGENAGHAVTIAARKLQIDTLTDKSAKTVARLAPVIDAAWAEWVETIDRESVYIVALTRVDRSEKKAAKK